MLSEEEKFVIETHMKLRKFRKKQYFLQEGDVCKYTGFIVKGSAKTFSVDEEGNENILKLSIENWWLTDFESFYHLTPSQYNIEAMEDLEVLQVTNAQVEEFFKPIPAFSAMMEVIKQNNAIANQRRVQAAISYTAEERYADFVSNYPHFLMRFPQNVIASYLGLSPETLSRLRKKINSK
ncbi:Crp/Fnr family transcriptional regulator [Chryseobacterium sp. W4I1]|uniref:Crp/Fnr family transcriptional regulator n=1 Tax=Chryseobacterium sp. W4I1 TaxID=3042293 RepID=UPI0027D92294|nr:Crp/Fnr family transcriptional regulator [Chryseobacterium sp. W4I1]